MHEMSLSSQVYEYLKRYEWLRRINRETRAAIHLLRNKCLVLLSGQLPSRRARVYQQSIPSYHVPLTGIDSAESLCSQADARRIRHHDGNHTVYFPPQERLRAFLGEIVESYPPDAGFKVLRNLGPPQQTTYIKDGSIRRVVERMMGPVTSQALAASALFAFELGPPCYGIVELTCQEQKMTAYVVRHVEGERATPEDCEEFVARLARHVSKGLIELVPDRRLQDPDFLAPDCNGNLLREKKTGKLMYIDFQQVLARQQAILKELADRSAETLHFGGSSQVFREGRRYLYQSIPGISKVAKRDCRYRWNKLASILGNHGISLHGRVVFDVCCNSGIMLSYALSEGARWGVGFDLAEVVPHAEKILSMLGASRVSLVPARLSPDSRLTHLVPNWLTKKMNDSVVFYLAAYQSVGLMRDVRNIPWKALLFEGHERDTKQQVNEYLSEAQSRWNCSLAYQGSISDGDCGTRTIALFTR